MPLSNASESLDRRPRITGRLMLPALWSSPALVATTYVAGYVGLDWVSFLHPFGAFGITPWNPSTGLSFVLVLRLGRRYLPLLLLAAFLAELALRGTSIPLVNIALAALIISVGYGLATLALLHRSARFSPDLRSMRDVALLLGTAALSSAAVAVVYVALFCSAGFIAWQDFSAAALRYWTGDMIGVAVVTPFLLLALTRKQPLGLSWEGILQIAAIVCGLALVFGAPQSRQFQLFYVLFLPIVWIAVRSGLEGVAAGLVVTQLGLIAALQVSAPPDGDVLAFQAMMLVLSLTGLAAGMLVTERRRAEMQLRLQQDAQARLARVGSLGELTTTIAHEINQPLMAAGTYTRLAAAAIAAGNAPEKAGEMTAKSLAQIERAAAVIRRLREFIRLGRCELRSESVARMVGETLELLRPELERGHITTEQVLAPNLPPVMADLLQVEQVLLNLVRNAVEAMRDGGRGSGVVTIEALRGEPGRVEVRISDTGPGFSDATGTEGLPSFVTTKSDGLGIGLALCRSIVEAHGGQLNLGNTTRGARVSFSLAVAEGHK